MKYYKNKKIKKERGNFMKKVYFVVQYNKYSFLEGMLLNEKI